MSGKACSEAGAASVSQPVSHGVLYSMLVSPDNLPLVRAFASSTQPWFSLGMPARAPAAMAQHTPPPPAARLHPLSTADPHDRLCVRLVQIFNQIYIAFLVMLIGYFALFGIKSFPIGTTLMIPLIIIAIIFRRTVAVTFTRPMENLSIHAAADLDRADKVRRTPLPLLFVAALPCPFELHAVLCGRICRV